MLQRKSQGSILPLANDRDTRMTIWQIAIDLVKECQTSTSGNKHILSIIDHLTGWLETFPISSESADTIVSMFINQYLPVHMCPRYILLDNGTEFKYHLMDQVLQQLGIDHIFSAPYHPQSNGKLEVFQKYLKPTLRKLCKKDPANCDKYINQVLTSYRVTPNFATAETPLFLIYGRNPNLPLQQLLELMQWFLGNPESGLLNLEAHHLALAIAKKTLDENCFRTAQKTTILKNRRQSPFQNQATRKMGSQMETWIQDCFIECDRHYLHIESQATGKTRSCNIKDVVLEPPVELWNIDTIQQSWEIHQPPCKFVNYHTQWLKMNTLLMYIVTCK